MNTGTSVQTVLRRSIISLKKSLVQIWPLTSSASLLLAVLSCVSLVQAATPRLSQFVAQANSMTPTPMPLVAPLFIEDAEFTSELVLVNASLEKTYSDVLLRDSDGNTIAQRRVSLAATSQTKVSIGDMLRGANSGATSGGVLVMPSVELRGMAVAAQLTLTFRKYDRASYIDEEFAMPSIEGSQELRGVADAGNDSPLLGITNLSANSQHISITCIAEHGSLLTQTVELTGSASIVVQACNENRSDHSAANDATSDDSEPSNHRALGISLKTDGESGSFSAFAINPHREKNNSVRYTSVPFADPKMIRSSGIVFAGVPMGTVALLSVSGEYNPVISLANFGSNPANVSIRLAAADATNADDPVVTTVKTVRLPADNSVTVELRGLRCPPGLRNSLILESDGAAGQIGAKLISYNEDAGMYLEQLDKDEKHPENAGLHPWSLDLGGDSTLLLFNHHSTMNEFNVQISGGGSTWRKTYKLRPFETLALSLRQVQLERLKDDSGSVLPRDLNSGEITWSNTAGSRGTGRLLVSNRELEMARSFSCASYYNLCHVSISPSSTQTVNVGGGVGFSESIAFCWAYNPGVCYGSSGGYGGVAGRNWSASGPLSGAGSCAGSTGCYVTANQAGEGWVWETVTDNNACTLSSSQTQVNVLPLPTAEEETATGSNAAADGVNSNGDTVPGFVMTISDAANDSFAGMTVQEAPGPTGSDGCWFPGSALDAMTQISGGVWTVENPNTYGVDYVGAFHTTNQYYIEQGRAPCTWTLYQVMQIKINGVFVTYSSPYNTLQVYVGDPTESCKQSWTAPAYTTVCSNWYYF